MYLLIYTLYVKYTLIKEKEVEKQYSKKRVSTFLERYFGLCWLSSALV